jgi:outer membrane immunogenic protein
LIFSPDSPANGPLGGGRCLAGAALLFAGPAVAADLAVKAPVYKAPPPEPVYSWTGCYVGATAGGASGKSDVSWAPNPDGFLASGGAIAAQTPASLSSTGFTGGGEVGCNYQFNPWLVVGVEGDGQSTGLGSTSTGAVSVARTTNPFTESFSSHWLATVRGRVGVASGQWLFFGSGGVAFANPTFSDSIFFPGSGTTNAATSSGTITGWTAGGGIEWHFMPHWSLKAEYLYVDFGTRNFTSSNSDPAVFTLSTIVHSHTLTEEIGRVGVNYRF